MVAWLRSETWGGNWERFCLVGEITYWNFPVELMRMLQLFAGRSLSWFESCETHCFFLIIICNDELYATMLCSKGQSYKPAGAICWNFLKKIQFCIWDKKIQVIFLLFWISDGSNITSLLAILEGRINSHPWSTKKDRTRFENLEKREYIKGWKVWTDLNPEDL